VVSIASLDDLLAFLGQRPGFEADFERVREYRDTWDAVSQP
jgi:hypothetical protein